MNKDYDIDRLDRRVDKTEDRNIKNSEQIAALIVLNKEQGKLEAERFARTHETMDRIFNDFVKPNIELANENKTNIQKLHNKAVKTDNEVRWHRRLIIGVATASAGVVGWLARTDAFQGLFNRIIGNIVK